MSDYWIPDTSPVITIDSILFLSGSASLREIIPVLKIMTNQPDFRIFISHLEKINAHAIVAPRIIDIQVIEPQRTEGNTKVK
jgi:hypothetical protein